MQLKYRANQGKFVSYSDGKGGTFAAIKVVELTASPAFAPMNDVADFVTDVWHFKHQGAPTTATPSRPPKPVKPPAYQKSQSGGFKRNKHLIAYVKGRAQGRCELCNQPAPFNDLDAEPFLECHHIVWLVNGGLHSYDNAVALCPNCHRKMHIVADRNDIDVLRTKAV